ncbi:BTAD domain-containing putative transcriptional regulator [Streptacidiphilus neutrinimicus]|uniref:BTAD domain-containing putative transcriptional regulator n=1 Tax=Streptacidiphilus neutrinimicus TaxID=105420 RepID=UPI000A9B26D1|nr:BTAD domain-containing putative transcriptional regulator [Streptacidiphilus neutrinimicus]
MLRIRILGSLSADREGTPVDLGAPRQRALLSLLVAARGSMVPRERISDRLWRGQPPPKADVSLQTYVSNLRRSLEPERPPRAPASLLVSAPPGYALRLPEDAVDAWRFETWVGLARCAPPERAGRLLTEALGWWEGPAYAENADEEWAAPEVARLNGLRAEARELATAADLRLGRAPQAALAAEALVTESPLREEGWRLLALAQWACGRQGDALASLRRASAVLREELGCDPGPALVDLEQAVLGQRLDVLRAAIPLPRAAVVPASAPMPGASALGAHDGLLADRDHQPGPSGEFAPERRDADGAATPALITVRGLPRGLPNGLPSGLPVGRDHQPGPSDEAAPARADAGAAMTRTPPPVAPAHRPGGLFVGRDREIRALEDAALARRDAGGVALVTGEAGAGKSALLDRLAGRLRAAGWRVVVGHCSEADGAPPAWPWVEALGTLARDVPPRHPQELAVLLREAERGPAAARDDATAGRFRMHRAFTSWLREAAADAPLAVVLEDLHRADSETLALLEAAAAVSDAPVFTVASYRPTETGEQLGKTLAVLAARSPHRIVLGGLPPQDVATVVNAVCGRPLDGATLAALAERTGGNPFYVLESARLLASEGALVAVSDVPQGVRDVLRRRLALLSAGTRTVLGLTAAAGLEAATAVLVDAAEESEEEVLDALEDAVAADLLTEPAPGRVRFVHALVRDTVYTDLAGVRRARLHARLAQALRRHRPDDLAALAHHFAHSGTPANAPLAVDYALRAAELAERRYAHDIAVGLIQQAIEVHTATSGDLAARPDSVIGLLVRLLGAQIRAGSTDAARRTRQHAVDLAERADRDDLVAVVYAAWTEPSPWRSRLEGFTDRASLVRLERLASRPGLDVSTRARVLQVLTDEAAAVDAPRALVAAREQLDLARSCGEPRLLAAALMTSAKLLPHETQAALRTPFLSELRELAQTHDLPAYRWVCEHSAAMTAASRNDPAALRRHTDEGLELARRYRMVWAQGVNCTTRAMLETVAGRFEAAEAAYAEAGELLQRVGARHAPGLRTLGLIVIQFAQGRLNELEPMVRAVYEASGEPTGVALALVLARRGRLEEARAVHYPAEPVTDHLYGVELDFRSQLAVLQQDTSSAATLVEHLLPIREQLAGAAGAAYATRPLAHALADLQRLLGEEGAAAENYALAERTAQAWGSRHLVAAARASAAHLAADRTRRRIIPL